MRSLQFQLHRNWDRVEDSTLVPWTPACLLDLLWWFDEPRLHRGVSLTQVSLDLDFWSDTSDLGWGAHLGPKVVSCLWSSDEVGVSIYARELLAVKRGLLHFQSSLRGSTVVIYVDNSTVVAYLRKLWGTRSVSQRDCSEDPAVVRASQGHSSSTVHSGLLADSLSRPHQILGSEWTLHAVFRDLSHLWPVIVDLFATSANHLFCLFLSLPGSSVGGDRCISPVVGRSSGLRIPSLVHHSPGPGEAARFSGDLSDVGSSVLASEAVVS